MVTVNATDAAGLTGSTSMTENVGAVPVVTVNAPRPNPANESQTVTVTWTVTSSTTVTNTCIDWGDGMSSCGLTSTSATHVYSTGGAKSKVFTITVNATNSAGTGSNTNSETVNDLAPTVTITAVSPNPTSEGSTVTVNFSVQDDETVSSTCINWGDGATACNVSSGATHAYSTNGAASSVFKIQVNATDSAGLTSSATTSITINDLAPTVTVSAPASANEGSPVTVTVTATDDEAISKTCVAFGDGSSSCTGPFTHSYSTGGAASIRFTVTVNATDSAGLTGSATTSVTINDLAPTVTVSAPSANEGSPVTVAVTTTDDEALSKTCVNFGDGSSSCTGPFTHTYSTGGTASKSFTITANSTDAAGLTGSVTTSIMVNDLKPTVTIISVSPSPALVGQTVSVGFTAADDEGIARTCVSFGDGSSACGTSPQNHSYSTSGGFTITVNATDVAGLAFTVTSSETVDLSIAVPTVSVNAPSPDPALTGQTVTLTWTVSSTATVTGVSVDWGDATSPDSLAGSATSDTHVYASTGNLKSETFTIKISATNSAGSGSGETSETVNDRAPTVTITSTTPNPVTVDQYATVTFTASEPDGTVTGIVVNWGDGTAPDSLPQSAVSDSHSYTRIGTFTISVAATDNSGNSGSASSSLNVAQVQQVKCGGNNECSVESSSNLTRVQVVGHHITLTAVGVKGTTGFANVTIPKGAVPSISRLTVTVDGNILPSSSITITSNSTDYFVYFTFTFHSPVSMDIDFAPPQNAANLTLGLDTNLFYEIVAGVIAVVMLVSATFVVRRKGRSHQTR
jgi:hypothetical protein